MNLKNNMREKVYYSLDRGTNVTLWRYYMILQNSNMYVNSVYIVEFTETALKPLFVKSDNQRL